MYFQVVVGTVDIDELVEKRLVEVCVRYNALIFGRFKLFISKTLQIEDWEINYKALASRKRVRNVNISWAIVLFFIHTYFRSWQTKSTMWKR